MPRVRLSTKRERALIGVLVLVGSLAIIGQARAQEALAGGAPPEMADDLSQVTLPGGLRAALAVLKDHNPPDRGQFLVELIRRVHHPPSDIDGPREPSLVALLAHLDQPAVTAAPTTDPLPLPLTPQVWTDVVFAGRATPPTLVREILRSRGASLLYYGLLAVDPDTRAFFAGEPGLLHEIVGRLGPAFALAAPSLRVKNGRIEVPGGEPAIAAWEALVGRRVTEPAEFVRTLLTLDTGRLAWFYGALEPLTPGQLRVAIDLDAPEPPDRVAAMRRLYVVFTRLAGDWRIEGRTFWRPLIDPALLIVALPVDAQGVPRLPGTRDFWSAVFAGASVSAPAHLLGGDRLDFPWLCERVFEGDEAADQRRRIHQVLFAARVAPLLTPAIALDAAASTRAVARYPALVGVLERLGVTDVALIARAARRAAELSAIDDDARAVRGLAQFQGLLALVGRATARGGVSPATASELAASLVAVDPGRHGDYEGRLVSWLVAHLDALAPDRRVRQDEDTLGELERAVVLALAGRSSGQPRVVDWEGSRYVVDVAHAEQVRLRRLLGDEPRPWLSSARALLALADSLGTVSLTTGSPTTGTLTTAARTRAAAALTEIARTIDPTDGDDTDADEADDDPTLARYHEVAAMFGVAPARRTGPRLPPRPAPRTSAATAALRVLADDLFARGMLELTYAAALGQPDRAWISAGDAARSHDFGLRAAGGRRPDAPWRRPIAGADTKREWRATGALLGLDVSLAELSLVRLSTRPPPRRPSVNEEDRRVLVESVALIEPAKVTDADLERIVSAIERGRTRLGSARTLVAASAIADDLRLSPWRRTLLSWTVSHDPARLPAFLSPSELLSLGLDRQPIDAALHAWGAPAEAIDGCLCLRVLDRQPWEMRAGRWGTGAFAGAFPDLNLRLGELLVSLQMPASLVGPVLASATLDLVNSTASRGQDDRRSLVEFVQALTPERVEQFLALLTTDGPLVPAEDAQDTTVAGSGGTRSGVPR